MNSRRTDQPGFVIDEGAARDRRGHAGAGPLTSPESMHGGSSDRPGLQQARKRAAGVGGLDAGGSEFRVLLAHNAATATCDALARHIESLGGLA